MKKIIVFSLLLTLSVASFSQSTTTAIPAEKTDYLKKSKTQKTAAWILLGGGVVMTSAAIAMGINKFNNIFDDIITPGQSESNNDGEVLFYTGLVAMAGSIPLFFISSKNKKKANNVSASFKMESRSYVHQSIITRTPYPALSLKLNL